MATIEERVREVAEQIVALPEDADRDYPLADMGLDSLDVTEFVMELEEEFNIEIGASEEDIVQRWKKLGDVIDYVESKMP